MFIYSLQQEAEYIYIVKRGGLNFNRDLSKTRLMPRISRERNVTGDVTSNGSQDRQTEWKPQGKELGIAGSGSCCFDGIHVPIKGYNGA